LTASAGDEIAQESDELRGSFFTHALVSGLLGAADRDRDGNVALDEAYRFAYENTLRSSSRSAAGLQHPTFFYDLRGQGQLVITRPFVQRERRGALELPPAILYLVFRDGPEGQVSAEVPADPAVRRLSLPPGTYFLRGRAADYVLEGSVQVDAGRVTRVDPSALTRIEYAHLARKGGARLGSVHAVEVLAQLRSPLPSSHSLCYGALGGYRIDTPSLAWTLRVGACTSAHDGATIDSRTLQLDAWLRASRVFDLSSRLAFDASVAIGGAYFDQRFKTRGSAPSRQSWAVAGELAFGLSLEIAAGTYTTLEAALDTYVLPLLDAKSNHSSVRPSASARIALGAGTRF